MERIITKLKFWRVHNLNIRRLNFYIQISVVVFFLISIATGIYILGKAPALFLSKADVDSSDLYISPEIVKTTVGNTFSTNVFLFPNGNNVEGVDVVLEFDPNYLKVNSVSTPENSGLNPFVSRIDPQNGKVQFSAFYIPEGVKQTISSDLHLASIFFQALKSTTVPIKLTFNYSSGGTDDSNIAIVKDGNVLDALLRKPNEVEINIFDISASPTQELTNKSPELIATPVLRPTDTQPTPLQNSSSSPSLTIVPDLTQTPIYNTRPVTFQESLLVYRAELKNFFWMLNRLEVVAYDSLSPDVELIVYDYSNPPESKKIGNLDYNKKTQIYKKRFFVFGTPSRIFIKSSKGARKEVSVNIKK